MVQKPTIHKLKDLLMALKKLKINANKNKRVNYRLMLIWCMIHNKQELHFYKR